MASSTAQAILLLKQAVALLEDRPPEPTIIAVGPGTVIGFKYVGGMLIFGDKSQHHITLLTDKAERKEFTFFQPPVTLAVGKRYTLVVKPAAPGELDRLISAHAEDE